MKCQILTSKDPPNTTHTDSPVSKPSPRPPPPTSSYLRCCQYLYHYLSLASYYPLSPPLLPAVSPLCYHHRILHLPCQPKINSTPDPSLSPCLLTSEGRYLAILNSLSSISLTNSANDVNKHTHINTHLLCYHNHGNAAAVGGRLPKNFTMWSEQRGKAEPGLWRPTLEMSASIMVLWFSWVGPGIAITLWLFIPVTENTTYVKMLIHSKLNWWKGLFISVKLSSM